MKAIICLSILLFGLQAHSQYVKKSDVTTMIATAIKPLQTTITKLVADTVSLAKRIADLTAAKIAQDKTNTNLLFRALLAEAKNNADSLFRYQQVVINGGVKATMDSSFVQLSNHFIIVGKVASINIPVLATQLKTYLGL